LDEIKRLHRAEFDRVMRNGKDLIILIYKENDPYSTICLNTIKEVNALIGKSFDLYLVDSDAESDVVTALGTKLVPEYISMKQCKIYKRSNDLLKANEVLLLLK